MNQLTVNPKVGFDFRHKNVLNDILGFSFDATHLCDVCRWISNGWIGAPLHVRRNAFIDIRNLFVPGELINFGIRHAGA